jgi:P27 family predicted phage terminase small subunit
MRRVYIQREPKSQKVNEVGGNLMPKTGNRPTPRALKILKGETRPGQLNKNEPTLPPKCPEPPPDMSKEALAVWHNLVPQLDAMGILTTIDQLMLGFLCQEIARYRRFSKLFDDSAPLIKDRDGRMRKNPMAQLCRDSLFVINKLASDFGLSPFSRARLTVVGPHDDDGGLEALLR